MQKIQSTVQTDSEDFAANMAQHRRQSEELRELVARLAAAVESAV